MRNLQSYTGQKMKFSIRHFFCKCDQIRNFLRIWSHLLKKSVMENFIFCAVKHSTLDALQSSKYASEYQSINSSALLNVSGNSLLGNMLIVRKLAPLVFLKTPVLEFLKNSQKRNR